MLVYDHVAEVLLPSRCAGCGIASVSGFCGGCRADLARIRRPCQHCGLPLPAALCPRQTASWALDTVVAPLQYAEPLSEYVQALKFAGRRHLGRALGELLVAAVRASPAAGDVDAIVPVPLHRRRFIARGYNQAVEIAHPVAAALSIRLLIAGIRRKRATTAQAQLAATARRANLRRAFAVTRNLEGLHIAIVDDVITTGATVNALARELSLAGARSVQAWAIARSL